jgi:HPt (histidine-containing phosphotransfer) domain-containing protein
MIVMSTGLVDPVSAPPLSPAERPIDLEHLSRMTLGDRALEREVLALFDRQAEMLIVKMQEAGPTVVSAYAHTLKGSAQGIGAFAVARAAEAVEAAANASDRAKLTAALTQLGAAVGEAKQVIAELLRAH